MALIQLPFFFFNSIAVMQEGREVSLPFFQNFPKGSTTIRKNGHARCTSNSPLVSDKQLFFTSNFLFLSFKREFGQQDFRHAEAVSLKVIDASRNDGNLRYSNPEKFRAPAVGQKLSSCARGRA